MIIRRIFSFGWVMVWLSMLLSIRAHSADQYTYLYPPPGAVDVPQAATILFRPLVSPHDIANVSSCFQVIGSKSGKIAGRTFVGSDGATIIFQPQQEFKSDENVLVTIRLETQNSQLTSFSFSFHILAENKQSAPFATPDEQTMGSNPAPLSKATASRARIMPNGVSVPSDFPHINVYVNTSPADGYIFLNNWRDENPYNIIFDNDGSPVWYERFADGDRRRDFKVQDNGIITMLTRHGGEWFLGYDQNFNLIDEFQPAGGYHNDEHELQVLENGHYLIIGRRNLEVDMGQVVDDGHPNANVRETTVQEFTADHQLIFNWPALEHFNPADMIGYCDPGQADPTASSFRFPHMNAIDIDTDGHILLSSRHLSEVTKIHRQSGEILWRLGGANNDFTFINDELDGFYMQHDIRALGNGLYSVFDNGNLHNPPRSRAVIYKLDTDAKTATLLWEYRNPPGTELSHYMGNAQQLPNGNMLINWAVGSRPKATEVTPEGEVVYEMNFAERYHTYRTFRFSWSGVVEQPRLFVEQGTNDVALIFNKFGDNNVAYYNIYGGTAPHPTTVIDTSNSTLKRQTAQRIGK